MTKQTYPPRIMYIECKGGGFVGYCGFQVSKSEGLHGSARLYKSDWPVEIDEDVREEYWTEIRKRPEWKLQAQASLSTMVRPNATSLIRPNATSIDAQVSVDTVGCTCFVSGHGFSHAERGKKGEGL
jgi:hypothetical protein